ncbi:MAG: HAD-IIB family hydrolase [Chromatiales bacterium]|jgi:sucrose-6F-phosphate phosphohydrolase
MNEQLLLCTDLDRTLIPNGPQPESPQARSHFQRLCASAQLTLAYVSGRHRTLVQNAIADYQLPQPDYVVGDVGTTIYRIESAEAWHHLYEWEEMIGSDWAGRSHADLVRLFADLQELRLQEHSKQNRYKLSYYVSLEVERAATDATMKERLRTAGINATLIWSVDEQTGLGLLDVLPAGATKLHAVEFLMETLGFTYRNTVFSGDSGNDMPVLVSPIPAILVNNAPPDVRQEAVETTQARQTSETLYIAKGSYRQMNGNYSAGILEGLAHYHPAWIQRVLGDE